MKKLITILAIAITLVSCTNEQTMEPSAVNDLGNVTFTYNGETISYNGENDPNKPETMVVLNSLLQTYQGIPSTQQLINLDSGYSKGAHFIGISYNPVNNHHSLIYARNGVSKVQNYSILTTNPRNLQIVITENTNDYISGTFSSLDINGTFTKIPKKK